MRTCRALLTVTTLSVLWSMPQMANACIVAYWGNDVDFASSEIDAWAYVDDSFNFGFCAQLVYEWGYFLHSYTASVEIEPPTGSPVSDSDSQPSVPYGGGSAYATATISFEDNPGVYTMQFQVGISCNLAGDVLSAFEQPNGGQVDLGISLGEGPTISGAVDLWWFNGESPSEYATSVTLTSGAGSSTQWSISAGSNIVSLSGTTGSTVVVTSTGRSETPNDVSVVATTSAGQTSHELTVRSPYRLQQTSNNLLIPCPYPGQDYMTQIAYEVYDKFDQVMARPVGINEYFPSGLEAEDIWPDHTWGGSALQMELFIPRLLW